MIEVVGYDRAVELVGWCKVQAGLKWSVDSSGAFWGRYRFDIKDPVLRTTAALRFA